MTNLNLMETEWTRFDFTLFYSIRGKQAYLSNDYRRSLTRANRESQIAMLSWESLLLKSWEIGLKLQ